MNCTKCGMSKTSAHTTYDGWVVRSIVNKCGVYGKCGNKDCFCQHGVGLHLLSLNGNGKHQWKEGKDNE